MFWLSKDVAKLLNILSNILTISLQFLELSIKKIMLSLVKSI